MISTAQLIERYGNPDLNNDKILDLDWAKDHLVVINLPFPMRLSWEPKTTIKRAQCHKLIAEKLTAALEQMASRVPPLNLYDLNLDRWGGCFEFRPIRGGNELSRHSWGVAVDINPDIGRLGNADDAAKYPKFIIESFENAGFIWGGRWKDRPDPMHFEIAQ